MPDAIIDSGPPWDAFAISNGSVGQAGQRVRVRSVAQRDVPLFAIDAPDAEARSSFGAQLTSYQFVDVAIVSGHSSAAMFQRTAQHIARSGIDNIALLVYAEGGCALDAEGRATEVHAGDVCFLDLSRSSYCSADDRCGSSSGNAGGEV